jgi:FKBP-type peptidyl-prolyl cis-trans isomerase (trigger factor)
MDRPDAAFPAFDLDRCRDLVFDRPVVEVLEDDVTAAFRSLAEHTPGLEDKRDFHALARCLGFADALALRREVRAQLERQGRDAVAKILRLRVIQTLLEHFDHEPEPAAVQREVASLVRDAEELGQQMTQPRIEAVVEPLAARRVIAAMLVRSLAESLHVEPSDQEVLEAFQRHAELYRDPGAVLERLMHSTAAAKPVVDELVENRVVEGVLALANVSERSMSLQQVVEELERVALGDSAST